MRAPCRHLKGLFVLALLANSAATSFGFSPLGPFAPWMTESLGYSRISYIGGPMALGEEYRVNVPVLTYGFDQSFLDYFGTNGVAAVQSAIATLNALPPVSQINPADYPLESRSVNYQAQSQQLYNLKSQALHLLLEHLGLASPQASMFALHQLDPALYSSPRESDWASNTIPNLIYLRNFDPQTLLPSHTINENIFYGYAFLSGPSPDVAALLANPFDSENTTVADGQAGIGIFYTGLSRDDVGGLAYLLATNNVNYEVMPPGVRGAGGIFPGWVNGAPRPGLDKITFLPHVRNGSSGPFLTMTNQFTDTYVSNNIVYHQQLERVITGPDILFSVTVPAPTPYFLTYQRSAATNWTNLAAENGDASKAGPGVINPKTEITFYRLGQDLYFSGLFPPGAYTADNGSSHWASFDNSTNGPTIYPATSIGTNQTLIRFDLWLYRLQTNIEELGGIFVTNVINYPNTSAHTDWSIDHVDNPYFKFEASSNFVDWISAYTITNDGNLWNLRVDNPSANSAFFRITPE